MLLSDRDIQIRLDDHELYVNPFIESNLQPASLDVTLKDEFIIYEESNEPINVARKEDIGPAETVTADYLILPPGQFILASTVETIGLPRDMAARFEGKSSLGRLGLMTHVSAGFIDPGFFGQITLEICNLNARPIIIQAGMKIGQVCFLQMPTRSRYRYGDKEYGSRYQGQEGPVASKVYDNL